MDGCSRVAGTGRCSWADRTNRVRWRRRWIDRTNRKYGTDRCGRLSRFWWRYRAFGTYWRGRQRGFPRFPRTYGSNRFWRKRRRNWSNWLDRHARLCINRHRSNWLLYYRLYRRYRGGVHNHRTNWSYRHPRRGVDRHRSDRLYRPLSYGLDRSGFDNHWAYRSHRHRGRSLHGNRTNRMDRTTDHRSHRRCIHSDGSYRSYGAAGCCLHRHWTYGLHRTLRDRSHRCCLHSDGTYGSDGTAGCRFDGHWTYRITFRVCWWYPSCVDLVTNVSDRSRCYAHQSDSGHRIDVASSSVGTLYWSNFWSCAFWSGRAVLGGNTAAAGRRSRQGESGSAIELGF